MIIMAVIVDRLESERKRKRPSLRHRCGARSEDELISNSYFLLRRGRKIVHPIIGAEREKERIACRLVCTRLDDAGGHDWSKTENGHI